MKHLKHIVLCSKDVRLAACLVLVLLGACSPEPAPPLFSAELDGVDGPAIDLSTLKSNRASVIVFVAPDCPLSRSHTLTLNAMAEDFRDAGIRFYGVIAGNWYSDDEIAGFRETYDVGFPIGVDPDYEITDLLGARVTPEVFLVDSAGGVLYAGAIDNWAGALAQHRTVTTEHYLRDALTGLAEGGAVGVEPVPAVGCFIEREG